MCVAVWIVFKDFGNTGHRACARVLTLLIGSFLLLACTTTGSRESVRGVPAREPVPSSHVAILFDSPAIDYITIGTVASWGTKDSTAWDHYYTLQGQAARLGADAVIVQEPIPQGPAEPGGLAETSGIAIVYATSQL